MKEKFLRLRYIIYQLSEEARVTGSLIDRKRKAEEAYALIDAELGLGVGSELRYENLTDEQKVELTARPHETLAEIKTREMLDRIDAPASTQTTPDPILSTDPKKPETFKVKAAESKPVIGASVPGYPKLLSDPKSSRPDRLVHNAVEESDARADGFTNVVPAPVPAHPAVATHPKPKP